jgi:hypothetical protein
MRARGWITLLLLCVSSPAFAQARRSKAKKAAPKPPAIEVPSRKLIPPGDDAKRDATLVAFLSNLRQVLQRRDRNGLLALLAPDIDIGRADVNGPSAFFTAWGLTDPETSVYGVLGQILSIRGAWVEERFCAPYVSALYPKDVPRANHQVILDPNVKLRAEASDKAAVVATLSYEIVEVVKGDFQWPRVRTVAGKEGYVPLAYLYSPNAYYACFARDPAGAWKLQMLAPPH